MSQCRIYHPYSAKKIVIDIDNDPRMQNKWRQVDETVGGWAQQNDVKIWFHCPSLTQHISPKNTSYEANRPLPCQIGMARDFIGEHRSIHEYWAEFGSEPRRIRVLPKLEIVVRENASEDRNRFLFTPEMAQKLAAQLNHYNCDIGEISFIGEDMLSWQDAERCLYPLRMTGKIMQTTLTISPMESIDMNPYELLFDAIDIEDDGSRSHLLEQYAANPFYTIRPKSQKEFANIPRLFGDDVFLRPILCPLATDAGLSKAVLDEHCACRWTLDAFFQNLDEILSGFRVQENCKSCHRLPKESVTPQTA
jgi:hypothetical protein